MPDKSDEWGWLSWLDEWERKGEMGFAVGLAGLATWLSAALPTAGTSHVNIWPPIAIFGVIALLGIYAMVAVAKAKVWEKDPEKILTQDRRWPLPGKANALQRAQTLSAWAMVSTPHGKTPESEALNRIAYLLQEILRRLPENDEPKP